MDAIMTFTAIGDIENPIISEEATVFSIPYSKIQEAQTFCENENLEYCFIGYKNYKWILSGIPDKFNIYIKVNSDGIHPEVQRKYLYVLTEK